MGEFVSAQRYDDIVLSVFQDNDRKLIVISSINKAAETILGYTQQELILHPFTNILEGVTCSRIDEYLDYSEEGADLFDVLSKFNKFCLKSKGGEIIPVVVKPYRVSSESSHKINYELLIRDVSISHKLGSFREKLLGELRYTKHPDFGITDESSTRLECDVVLDFLKHYEMDALICAIKVDHAYDIKSVSHVVNVLHRSIRKDDIVGYLGNGTAICILLKCRKDDANSAVARLHRAIRNDPDGSISASIAYKSMRGPQNGTSLIASLNKALSEMQNNGGNQNQHII